MAWDLGFAPKPPGPATRRYLAVVNAEAAGEAGDALGADRLAALAAYAEELGRSGAYQGMDTSSRAAKGSGCAGPAPG